MKQKAVIYVRVSSKEQKEEGYSIPAQKRLLRDFAVKNNLTVAKVFEDNETAKRAGREAFGKMLDYLDDNPETKTVLVEKTDRLYRNLKDYVRIDELDLTVHLVKENEKLGKDASSHQKLIHGIKVLLAKNHVDNLSEEVIKGYEEKVRQGIYPGSTLPIGYKLQKIGKRSLPVVDEKNRHLAVKIFEYYATGLYSLNSLIEKIKKEGLFIPSNLPSHSRMRTLTKSSMARLIQNPIYYGDFTWKDKLHKGTHEPIITKELWDKAQAVLNRLKRKPVPKYNTIPFTFKGLLSCGECGRSITAEKKIKPSGREYVYYRCTKFQTNCQQKPINETLIHRQIAESLKTIELPQKTIEYVTEALKQSLEVKRSTADKERELLVEQKALLEKRLDRLYEDKLDENISEDFYQKKQREFADKIEIISKRLAKRTKANISYYKLGNNILELAKRASTLYQEANLEEKQQLLSFLLLNSTLKDKKVTVQYKKPFDLVHQKASCFDWRGRPDSNRRPTA
jgi:site-specific DNA recombinase